MNKVLFVMLFGVTVSALSAGVLFEVFDITVQKLGVMFFGPGEVICECEDANGTPIPCDESAGPMCSPAPASTSFSTGIEETSASTLSESGATYEITTDNSQTAMDDSGMSNDFELTSDDLKLITDSSDVATDDSEIVTDEPITYDEFETQTDDSSPTQNENCSLEFYRTHASAADGPNALWPAGYNPNQKFGDAAYFYNTITLSTSTDPTLLDALNAEGDGINKLAREAVTALLNAANPDVKYHFSVTQVIDMTQEAITSYDYSVADEFEGYNAVDGTVLCQDKEHDDEDDDDDEDHDDEDHDG